MIRSLCLAVLFAVPVVAMAQPASPVPVVEKGKTAVKLNPYRIVGTNAEPTCWVKLLNTTTNQWSVNPVINGYLPGVSYVRDGVVVYDFTRPFPYSGGNEEVAVEVPFKDTTPNGVKKPDVPKNDGGKVIPDTPKIKPVVQPETAPAPKEATPPKIMPKVIEGPKRDK